MSKNGAEYPDIVDLVTEGDDYINLIIVQTTELSDNLLSKLQEKLNNYLEFALGGQLHDEYPTSRGKEVIITVDLYDGYGPSAKEFLERACEVIAKAGVTFKWGMKKS